MARVKAEREAQIASSRSRRYAIVEQEASVLRDLDRKPPELSTEELNALIEELEQALDVERRKEEERMMREQQLLMAESDEEMRELILLHRRMGDGAREGEVLCPVCSVDCLNVREGVVFCRCGLRLDGGTYDNLTLDLVRERLLEVIEEHGRKGCARQRPPTFSCREKFGFTFMHAFCDACDLDCIVL